MREPAASGFFVAMITVRIYPDYTALNASEQAILNAPRRFRLLLNQRVNKITPLILRDIRNAPPRPKYPIEWQSERQRRAFFATDGFGRGIPYRRTGRVQASWQVNSRLEDTQGRVVLENIDPKAIYVQGDIVQRMHLVSGWPQVDDVVARYDVQLADMVVQSWDDVVRTL